MTELFRILLFMTDFFDYVDLNFTRPRSLDDPIIIKCQSIKPISWNLLQ